MRALTAMLTLIMATLAAAADAPPVAVNEDEANIIMDNGVLALTVSKANGQMVSIRHRPQDGEWVELAKPGEGLYWDANVDLVHPLPPERAAGPKPRAGYSRIRDYLTEVKVVEQGPDAGEVMVTGGPSFWFPMQVEYHFRLPRGQSGFYAWTILSHGPGMPAANLAQTRLVLKGDPSNDTFSQHYVDDERIGRKPGGKQRVANIQDATYRFDDGSSYTKYDLAAFTHQYLAHGMAGPKHGLWVLYPSTESFNGGPLRQDLTVHDDNILLAMWHSSHYGAPQVELADDEPWRHLYGPVMFYVNSGREPDALWTDAKIRALEERKQWPYRWLQHSEYPLVRGDVTGSVAMSDGTIPAGAWVVLTPPEDTDHALSARGYRFWSRVQPDGRFTIRNVRPGIYTLHVSGGEPEDLRREQVVVSGGQTTDLGAIEWTPVTHGRRLWQIGTFNRSTIEYVNGEERFYRSYDAFKRYFTNRAFAEDVTFTIGRSRESTHWNYAHWAWYRSKPYWSILFDVEEQPTGRATLTIGLAAARPAGALVVTLNGAELASFDIPKTGAAGYRSGGQDSRYTLKRIQFDVALLKQGRNEITLGHSKAVPVPDLNDPATRRPPGEVMYDALRLEVE